MAMKANIRYEKLSILRQISTSLSFRPTYSGP